MYTEESLREQIEPIVGGLGFAIVEFHCRTVNRQLHAYLVLYSPSGVGADDCAAVHKTVYPRLSVLTDTRDLALEVASPGIDRTFKSWSEFDVFTGRGVRVLERGSGQWLGGLIECADEQGVTLLVDGSSRYLRFDDLQKAKLDYTVEVN